MPKERNVWDLGTLVGANIGMSNKQIAQRVIKELMDNEAYINPKDSVGINIARNVAQKVLESEPLTAAHLFRASHEPVQAIGLYVGLARLAEEPNEKARLFSFAGDTAFQEEQLWGALNYYQLTGDKKRVAYINGRISEFVEAGRNSVIGNDSLYEGALSAIKEAVTAGSELIYGRVKRSTADRLAKNARRVYEKAMKTYSPDNRKGIVFSSRFPFISRVDSAHVSEDMPEENYVKAFCLALEMKYSLKERFGKKDQQRLTEIAPKAFEVIERYPTKENLYFAAFLARNMANYDLANKYSSRADVAQMKRE